MLGYQPSDKTMQVMGAKYFLLLSWPISALSFRVRLRGRNVGLPAQRQDNASDGGEVFPPPIMAYIGAII